jgi:hypothetical protein
MLLAKSLQPKLRQQRKPRKRNVVERGVAVYGGAAGT